MSWESLGGVVEVDVGRPSIGVQPTRPAAENETNCKGLAHTTIVRRRARALGSRAHRESWHPLHIVPGIGKNLQVDQRGLQAGMTEPDRDPVERDAGRQPMPSR